jgi:hypothetical protein
LFLNLTLSARFPKNLKTYSGQVFQGIAMNRIVFFACVFLIIALLSVNIVLTLWKPSPASPPLYQEITAVKNRLTVKIWSRRITHAFFLCFLLSKFFSVC